MTMRADVMPPGQQALLRRLGPFAMRHGFYLGGGTAVAIQLGHRRSVDLDWFTGDRLEDPLRLAATLREAGFGHVLFSLTFFDDAEAEAMPEMLWDVEWAHVRRTIEHWIREYVRRTS